MEKSLIQCLRNYKIDYTVTLSYLSFRKDGFMGFKTHRPKHTPLSYNPIPWAVGEIAERKDEACDVWENL